MARQKKGRRGGFGWTAKHHGKSSEALVYNALDKVITGQKVMEESGSCIIALRYAAEAARVLGRAFQDFQSMGQDAFKHPDFKTTDGKLDQLLHNIQGHCLKG
jgi:hypothetical protein